MTRKYRIVEKMGRYWVEMELRENGVPWFEKVRETYPEQMHDGSLEEAEHLVKWLTAPVAVVKEYKPL